MKYQSARSLKTKILGQENVRAVAFATTKLLRVRQAKKRPVPPVAIGITGSKNKFKIAIRIQRHSPLMSAFIQDIGKLAKGEIDVNIIGNVHKQAIPWHQKTNRPLRIGGSIGHVDITAGTLGCFVTKDGSQDFVLSNNHVLANENNASKGDDIIQPGDADGGVAPSARVGELHDFVKLSKTAVNFTDCAISTIDEDTEYFFNHLETLGEIKGVRTAPLDEGDIVFKVGRTTGVTKGKVTAIEVDQLKIGFDLGDLKFDNQIEIGPIGSEPFSLGGDSGSLVLDSDLNAVGLLFAGNDVDATFANPIQTVLDQLDVSLVF